MARTGWRKPVSDRRLSDLVSVGLITRVFPPDVVDEVIEQAGRTQLRKRSLPARAMAYFSIGMALFSDGSYEDVFAHLTDGLAWASGWSQEALVAPSKSAIFQARARLGFEPLALLFARVARPLAVADTPGSWLAGRRLMAIDGTCLDVADTPENAEFFGRPGVSKGEQAAFPQARLVALAECGTQPITDAVIGSCTTSETELSGDLVGRLVPGMLVLGNRGFYGFRLWQQAVSTGADLLWRVSAVLKPHYLQTLSDGSWLAEIRPPSHMKASTPPFRVRVIDYTIDDGRENPETYRLLTTIMDPADATATDLAAVYSQRWEIESAFDELKTHQRGPRTVLRSKSPALVLQEIWGHLCCHYAIRTLMHETAAHAGEDPDRVSFVAALRIARRSVAKGDFSP